MIYTIGDWVALGFIDAYCETAFGRFCLAQTGQDRTAKEGPPGGTQGIAGSALANNLGMLDPLRSSRSEVVPELCSSGRLLSFAKSGCRPKPVICPRLLEGGSVQPLALAVSFKRFSKPALHVANLSMSCSSSSGSGVGSLPTAVAASCSNLEHLLMPISISR